MRSRIREITLALVVVVVASSCGSGAMSPAESAFIAQMTPHHRLGIRMNEIAALKANDVRLRRMVFEMAGYHHTDIEHLDHWSNHHGIDPAVDYPGLIDEPTLLTLEATTGLSFDIAWLEVMIEHHEGALQIAQTVLKSQPRNELATMATRSIEIQSGEINAMQELLEQLERE